MSGVHYIFLPHMLRAKDKGMSRHREAFHAASFLSIALVLNLYIEAEVATGRLPGERSIMVALIDISRDGIQIDGSGQVTAMLCGGTENRDSITCQK